MTNKRIEYTKPLETGRVVVQLLIVVLFLLVIGNPLRAKADSEYPTMDDAEMYIRSLNLKTDYEIFREIVKFCANNYDYNASYSSAESMTVHGGGDCWASTDFIIQMCKRFGIEAEWRFANREDGAGSGHRNAIAKIGDTYYVGDAGYGGKKPRYYRVEEEPGGFWVTSDGILVQYDGFDEDVYIPEKVGDITIKTIGLSRRNEHESGSILRDGSQKVKSFHITDTVENIIPEAFGKINSLENIYVDAGNLYYKSEDGILLTKDGKELLSVPRARTEFEFPKSVEVIGGFAFAENGNIKEIIIPNAVTEIKNYAFFGCQADRIFVPKTITKIGEYAFYNLYFCSFLAVPGNAEIEGENGLGYLGMCTNEDPYIYTDSSSVENYVKNMKLIYTEYQLKDGKSVPTKKQWPNPKVKRIASVYEGVDYSKGYNYFDYSLAHFDLWRECDGDPDIMLEAFAKECVWPEGIGLSLDTLTLEKGASRQITAKVVPENAFDKSVTWSCSNTKVAEIDKDGNVTAKSAGKATITGTTINGKTSQCIVTVIIKPTEINLNQTSLTMYYGDTYTLEASLSPADATEKNVTWSISNPSIGSVNGGVIKVWGAGKAVVTAKTTNGLTATCEIHVFADNHPDNIFADIKYDTWKYNAAKAVQGKGYMTGIGDLDGRILFSPDSEINRSQFVVALYSMAGKPEVEYEQKFSDVESGKWYSKQVTWASNNGIVAGNGDGTFGINGKATREQLALMFYKYAENNNYDVSVSESTTLDGFTDADKVSNWAVTAVKWAVERGIISGKGNATDGYRIDPQKGATRIECAAMMNKIDEIYADALRMGAEDQEEPLALPMEEIEDIPIPEEEMEDIIIEGGCRR